MARLIKCPRCQSQLDVTNVQGGTTMRCSDCGAMLRVPTGTTGQYQKVPSGTQPAVQKASSGTHAKVGGRSTSLFKKMSGVKAPGAAGRPPRGGGEERRGGYAPRRSSNTATLVIGVGGGIVVLIIVMVLALGSQASRKEAEKAAKEAYKREVAEKNRQELERQRKEDEEYEKALAAQKEAEKAGKKSASLVKKAGGSYDAPATFEPGASKQKTKAADLAVDEALVKEYEALASQGKIKEILDNDQKWTPYIINALISDDEKIAKTSFQALADFCVKHKISSSEEGFKNPVKMELVNSAYYRGGEYTFWTEWWSKDKNKGEIAARGGKGGDRESARVVGEDPARAKWDEIMGYLRAGGGFDDPKRPEGMAFQKVQNMGEGAYPYLVKYVDNEDILLAKAACRVLNMLMGKDVPMPTEATRGQVKTQWENLIKK
jgi:DNA-directed RNA polymerase subunit M/transcription elongation factor TFIIS